MSAPNGKVPPASLTTVAPGVQLLNPVARAYKTLVTVAELDRIAVRPAGGEGSGYRDLAMQELFWQASRGDAAAAAKVGLNPNSVIRVAAVGYSSHGWGTRIDLLFNDSATPNSADLSVAARYGFTREFGNNDPDHFMHDGQTAIHGPSDHDTVRVVATYLNGRDLGEKSTSSEDGQRDRTGQVVQRYCWEVQRAGHLDRIYPKACKEDGKWGHYTQLTEDHYAHVLFS